MEVPSVLICYLVFVSMFVLCALLLVFTVNDDQ